MKTKIINYIKAAYSGLYILSSEEQRVESEMQAVADAVGYELYVWSLTTGIVNIKNKEHVGNTNDPLPALEHFKSLPEKSILLLRDFHMLLAQPDPMLFRAVKDALRDGMGNNRHLVIMGCTLHLPAELEKGIYRSAL